MSFSAKILADSLAPSGARLTTFELTYPRCIHSEIMTHRVISRNAASSRAIPVEKMIARVEEDPFVPIHWGKNQKGMQAEEELSPVAQRQAQELWLMQRDSAVMVARQLLASGLHKQIANRLLEPWMWITVIASATTWSNFFDLRCHRDAEPHFQKIAGMARELYDASVPRQLLPGAWHMPLIDEQDWAFARDCVVSAEAGDGGEVPSDTLLTESIATYLHKVSVGRCARVSYLTHDGKRDLVEDVALHDRLMNANPGHWSPFEHVARAEATMVHSGNFVGFTQYRKLFEQEHIGGRMP